MPFKTPNKTSEYIRSVLPKETDSVLRELEAIAEREIIPIILPEAVPVLKQLIMLKRPKKILEIGTAIGYSSQIMLKACQSSHLYTIEIREDYVKRAREFFSKANLTSRVTIFCGDAYEIVPLIDGSFDFIFLDGAKTGYIEYLPYLKKCLNDEGILLCDNVLFNGMVSGEEEVGKKQSIVKKLDKFISAIMNDENFTTSILPVGDGLSLSIKNKQNQRGITND